MLKESTLQHLKGKKNLLAFSAGGDSTALFFLLQDANITFDIAIVNYKMREQSEEEVRYAHTLARKHSLQCHQYNAPTIEKNIEAKARKIRYTYFEKLIQENSYDNLLTAHHLGDRFEWMLMQFCKGAGCIELAGMQEIDKRQNYTLIRPLLHKEKSELLAYLQENAIMFYEDATNDDEKITRNAFRHQHTKPLLQEYAEGIKKSFDYIDSDKNLLQKDIEVIRIKELAYFVSTQSKRADIFAIDKYLKEQSHLLSASERELLQNEKVVVVGRKFVVNQTSTYVFIIPYTKQKSSLTKDFKEACRKLKIEPKLREYLFTNKEVFQEVKLLLCRL